MFGGSSTIEHLNYLEGYKELVAGKNSVCNQIDFLQFFNKTNILNIASIKKRQSQDIGTINKYFL